MDPLPDIAKYWRSRQRRERALASIGVLVLLGWTLALLVRDLRFILIAGAVVAWPVWLVIESWLALRFRSTPAQRLRNFLLTSVAALIGFAIGCVPRTDKLDWEIWPVAVPLLAVVVVRTIYTWRDSLERPIGLLSARFDRISREALQAHLATYGLSLAVALAATTAFEGWLLRSAAYVGGALIGKLAADFVYAKPDPIEEIALPRALTRMTVLSPLWWGLPWGVLAAGYFIASEPGASSTLRLGQLLPVVSHIAVAVVLVFAGMTAAVYLQSLGSRAAPPPAQDDEAGLSPTGWSMLYAGVVFAALAAYAITFVPWWRSDEERFGVETWTCATDRPQSELGWVSKTGLRIRAIGEAGYIYLYDVSCVPRADGQSCGKDVEGWEEIEVIVRGADEFATTVRLNRKSKNVHAYKEGGAVFGELATELLWALAYRKTAELKIKAPGGRLLYTKQMDLSSYNKAFRACVRRWRKEQGYDRTPP